jgi:hypothetical protein
LTKTNNTSINQYTSIKNTITIIHLSTTVMNDTNKTKEILDTNTNLNKEKEIEILDQETEIDLKNSNEDNTEQVTKILEKSIVEGENNTQIEYNIVNIENKENKDKKFEISKMKEYFFSNKKKSLSIGFISLIILAIAFLFLFAHLFIQVPKISFDKEPGSEFIITSNAPFFISLNNTTYKSAKNNGENRLEIGRDIIKEGNLEFKTGGILDLGFTKIFGTNTEKQSIYKDLEEPKVKPKNIDVFDQKTGVIDFTLEKAEDLTFYINDKKVEKDECKREDVKISCVYDFGISKELAYKLVIEDKNGNKTEVLNEKLKYVLSSNFTCDTNKFIDTGNLECKTDKDGTLDYSLNGNIKTKTMKAGDNFAIEQNVADGNSKVELAFIDSDKIKKTLNIQTEVDKGVFNVQFNSTKFGDYGYNITMRPNKDVVSMTSREYVKCNAGYTSGFTYSPNMEPWNSGWYDTGNSLGTYQTSFDSARVNKGNEKVVFYYAMYENRDCTQRSSYTTQLTHSLELTLKTKSGKVFEYVCNNYGCYKKNNF